MTYQGLRSAQIKYLTELEIDPSLYGLHSGRNGAVFDSASAGNAPEETCTFGGWTANSRMPERYDQGRVKRARTKVANALKL